MFQKLIALMLLAYMGDIFNVSDKIKMSLRSLLSLSWKLMSAERTCHQRILIPTSVTNVVVASNCIDVFSCLHSWARFS